MVSSYERSLAEAGTRKGLGAYYTPDDVVSRVLDLCLQPLLAARALDGAAGLSSVRVLDPACGTGNFLVGAAERIAAALEEAGVAPDEARRVAVEDCVAGVDIDPEAVSRCRTALGAFADGAAAATVHRGDALLDSLAIADGSFDLVVGNPPFLSQLGRGTARTTAEADALRRRYGAVVGAYTDPAVLFMVRSVELARPDDGLVALLEPLSMLSAADAGAARSRLLGVARLDALWSLETQVFDAAVEVCLPVLRRTNRPGLGESVDLFVGRDRAAAQAAPAPTASDATWSSLLASLAGVPTRDLCAEGLIGDLASATADFRDQYYGLAPHVVDRPTGPDERWPKLVTTGLVDPADVSWGTRTTTFNKTRYRHPRVDREALPAPLRAWADRRLQPKVLVATQTRVIEAVVDPQGTLVPSVPLLSVTTSGDDLWRVAAALTSPALTMEVLRRHLGSGRSPKAVRLRAADVADLPLPRGHDAWADACGELERAHGVDNVEERRERLRAVGRAMNRAYGLGDDEDLLEWWLGRMPAVHR